MTKPKLSPQEKRWRDQRMNLTMLHNKLLSRHSFKELKTWGDFYRISGLPEPSGIERDLPITLTALKELLQKQTDELERTIRAEAGVETDKQQEQGLSKNLLHRTDMLPAHPPSPIVPNPTTSQTNHAPTQPAPTVARVTETATNKPADILTQALDLTEKNDYGFTPSKNEDAFHYWFQKKAISQCIHKIKVEKKKGLLVVAETGSGKTFIAGAILRRLEDELFYEGKTWSHIPYIYVTRASIVTQTQRVLEKHYHLGVENLEVINIEQLRSNAGRLWVKEVMDIIDGEEVYRWEWKPNINPCVIVWDECQALKNDTSTQHKIAAAFNDLKTKEKYQLFVSATPFTRVSEAKCFAVSTGRNIEHLGFPKGTVLSNETWPLYARAIASPSKPDEYNEEAVKRLMKDLDEYVVSVKGVRKQFDAQNDIEIIHFKTSEEKQFYEEAWERYLKEKSKLDAIALAEGRSTNGINELVAFQKFRMAAELCRKRHLATEMYDIVRRKGKAAICALNFKGSIISVVKILVEDFNVPRDQISLIWGGGQTDLTKKQKDKKKILDLQDKFLSMGMSAEEMLEQLGLDEVEDRIIEELDPSLRLGNQTPEERQREIDKFQSGKSLYCLFTFRAGGVGLSLHHTDEFTTQKVRHKESGYAFEEDIPNIPVRPRESLIAPTYSAIELVQGLGRAPRLTSLSDTVQRLLFYGNTVESDVAAIVSRKLRCLAQVVRNREKWMDVATDGKKRTAITQAHIDSVPEDASGETPVEVEE